MKTTHYHAKLLAYELTKRCSSDAELDKADSMGGRRTASSFHEYVCSVTPIFLTAIGNGLTSPHLDFDLW